MGGRSGNRTLQELADREAIRELTHRYAHCVWMGDAAGAAALFAENGVMDTGDRPPLRGRDAIEAEYRRVFPHSGLQPFVHNHIIELDGDRARGTCALDLRATMGGESMIGSGYYEDEYVREKGQWRFLSRRLHMRFLAPVTKGWAEK